MLNKKTHEQLLLPKNNKTQVNSLLNIPMLFLYDHMNKEGYFYSHENIYGIPLLARLSIPHQKTWKVSCKLREVNVIH